MRHIFYAQVFFRYNQNVMWKFTIFLFDIWYLDWSPIILNLYHWVLISKKHSLLKILSYFKLSLRPLIKEEVVSSSASYLLMSKFVITNYIVNQMIKKNSLYASFSRFGTKYKLILYFILRLLHFILSQRTP